MTTTINYFSKLSEVNVSNNWQHESGQSKQFLKMPNLNTLPKTVKLTLNNNKVKEMINKTPQATPSEKPTILSLLILPFIYALALTVLISYNILTGFIGFVIEVVKILIEDRQDIKEFFLDIYHAWLDSGVYLNQQIKDFKSITLANWLFYVKEITSLLNPFYKEDKIDSYFNLLD